MVNRPGCGGAEAVLTLVDSPVWSDYFRGALTPQTDYLDRVLGRHRLRVADLILAEVLGTCLDERDREQAEAALRKFPMVRLGGEPLALKAARNARILQRRGHPLPPTVDTLLATFCLETGHALLHASPAAFEPFERHLGLKVPHLGI
jgi:predicted nucleic acid-binding protein